MILLSRKILYLVYYFKLSSGIRTQPSINTRALRLITAFFTTAKMNFRTGRRNNIAIE